MEDVELNWETDENGLIYAEPEGIVFSYLILKGVHSYMLKIIQNKEYFGEADARYFDSLVEAKDYANDHFRKVLDNLLVKGKY
jgi:hypothetical protein